MRKEIENGMLVTPLPVLLIGTYDENDVPNIMNAAWGVQSDYHEITIYLAQHKTTDNLKLHGAFTVSFATRATVKEADYFGMVSGTKVNKVEKAGFHAFCSDKVHAPLFEELPVSIECKVKSLDDEMILIGEVVGLNADESVMTNGKVDLTKMQPVMFDSSMNVYRVIGEETGKAFSIGLELK